MRSILLLIALLGIGLPARGQLAADIEAIRKKHDLMGGVALLFCADGIVEQVPFGTADLARGIPVSDSTLFRVASIAKTITAMAFLQLVEQGKAGLDDDIGDILGYSVRNPKHPQTPITPRTLLSHTSSLVDGSTYDDFLGDTYAKSPMPALSALLVPGGSYHHPSTYGSAEPGSWFQYANINAVILGTLVEKLSGQRFDTYCRDAIFLPLGMDASFNVHDLDLDRLAVLYRKPNGAWTPQADNYLGVPPGQGNLAGYQPGTNGARFGPQGGLRISGAGLARIFMLLLGKGSVDGKTILSPASVQAMCTPQWTFNGSNGNDYYGLFRSWGLGLHRTLPGYAPDDVLSGSPVLFGHPGEAYGLVSSAYIDTSRQLGLVFITNGCGKGYASGAGSAFYTVEKEVFQALDPLADALDCQSTGMGHIEDRRSEPRVFPNPFGDTLYIADAGGHAAASWHLTDPLGRSMGAGSLPPDGRIELGGLPQGLYLLQLRSGTRWTGFAVRKR